jgi:hypothetical protein
VSAWDPAYPSGDHSNKRSSWHALIEPHIDRPQPVTPGIEKSYDVSDFVFELREKAVSPHIAQNTNTAVRRSTAAPPAIPVMQSLRVCTHQEMVPLPRGEATEEL